MKAAEAIKDRIDKLTAEVPSLMRVDEYDSLLDSQAKGACIGWIAAALHVVQIACASIPNSGYLTQANDLQKTADAKNYIVHHNVLAMVELLKQLKTDIEDGLLTTVERQVSAETYDDLMDHAEAYLAENRKDPAGVIAGVVFEDTIRRLCRANSINDRGQTLDPLINALAGANHLTKLEAKEARTSAGLRTSATHALWNEFNADQVRTVIAFTHRLVREKLNP
jgi:hypothetical protein